MNIAEFLPAGCVIPHLYASDKERLLQELARLAAARSKIPQKTILDALDARESLGSTGLGAGFALPHARIKELDHFFGLFAKLARPIPYQAVDDKPVDLAFLVLIPAGAGDEYIRILAAISRRIRDPGLAKRLRETDDPAVLHALLVGG